MRGINEKNLNLMNTADRSLAMVDYALRRRRYAAKYMGF